MAEVEVDSMVDGRYRVLSRLGAGGMADVYCADDTHLGRRVALKVLYRRFAQDAQFVERFKREAQSAAGLAHPNVVSVYDRGEHDGTYYIAMEYLPGRTLKEVVATQGPLDQEAVVDIGVQILRAASFAHRRGVIHRDLKPHNVMIDDAGGAKVTDFGIARAGASEMTEAGSIMGTAQYLSPEQAQGHPATAQSDLYSVGIILYELLTGRLPFDGESAVAIAVQHLNDAPTPIHVLRPDVAPELEAAVMRALEKDPSARWADADEFSRALEGARAGLATQPLSQDTAAYVPVVAPTAPAAYEEHVVVEEEEPERRWPWIALGLTALLLGIVALLLLTGKDEVEVMSVVGKQEAVAVDQLQDDGFDVETNRQPDLAAVGEVIAQDPNGGTKADEGSTVTLTVSSGPGEVTVPTVASFPEKRAVRELSRAGCGQRDDTNLCGFKVEVRQQSSDSVDEGEAIKTDPPGGTQAEVGSRVLLFISTGPRQVEVPDVIDLARESAEATLNRAGLGFTIREQESDQEPGTVIAQDPAGGQVVEKGARVQLTVAKEPERVEVTDVVGDTEDIARTKLTGAGFRVRVETEVSDEVGIVLDQRPNAGTDVEEGDVITITVGEEAPPPDEEQQGDENTPPPNDTGEPGALGE